MGFLSNLFGFGKRKEEVIRLLQEGAIIIDVRTQGEYAGSRIEGSVNVPLNALDSKVSKLKKLNKPMVICCESGARSAGATSMLKSKGFTEVVNGGSWRSVAAYKHEAERITV